MSIIGQILKIAATAGASDIHISSAGQAMMRVRGRLTPISGDIFSADMVWKMAEEMMTDGQMEEMRSVGECDFAYEIAGVSRYRVNAYMSMGAPAIALRAIPTEIPPLSALSIPQTVVDLYQKKHGLILLTGPTGCGKSTTIASILNVINQTKNLHIITLEDPIEYIHRHKGCIIHQREIGRDTKSYAASLRAALREDPDVIMVGEMRDFETISIAITAAETGHLVFSTLHTVGVASAIDRMVDVFPAAQQAQIRSQLSGTIEAIINQQLLPRADGTGLVPAFEILHSNNAIRNLIREGKTHQIASAIQTSKASGMVLMDEYIAELYAKHIITADTAIEYARDPITIRRKLVG